MAIYNVVKFEGTGIDWLIYKHPGTEFNTRSKLIVSTGQVAILVHNGQLERICQEGTFTMDTELIPFAKSFVKNIHGKSNPYPLEVYFINTRLKLDLLWGTNDPISLLDPIYKIQLQIRARGQMGIKLNDYQYFMESLVGTLMKGSIITFYMIRNYFRGTINQKIKKILANYIVQNNITYFEIDLHLDNIQAEFERCMKEEVSKFGFEIINLSIESINVPEENLTKLNEILHKKAEYEQLGDDVYRTSRGYDVLEEGAKNNSSAGAFMGVGIGMNVANQTQTGNIIPSGISMLKLNCPYCQKEIQKNAKFCPECGKRIIKVCPKCNKSIEPGQKFCLECGERLYE